MKEKKIMHILEWIHPALLLALAGPFLYVFYKERVDTEILPLYLIGLSLIVCTAVSRMAAFRTRSFPAFLGICAFALAGTLFWAGTLGMHFLNQILGIAVCLALLLEGIWMILDAGRIRMREKRRKRAMDENDISWTDSSVLLEKPLPVFLPWFVIVYLAALLNHCPILCDLALVSGCLYLLLLCAYLQLEATEDYLSETEGITHVPKQKIRRLRLGMLLASLLVIYICMLPAFLTGSLRKYQDLRFREISYSDEDALMEPFLIQEPAPAGGVPDWLEELAPYREVRTPKWLEHLGMLFLYACAGVLLFWILRGITGYFLEFRGVPEENGDEAITLNEETAQRIPRYRRMLPFGGLSEKEKIRRTYRRKIRRYRKSLPQTYEAPNEIEEKTDFPETIDVKELHETYERARYGR